MKITVEAASSAVAPASRAEYNIYLNGDLQGWLGFFGKLEIEDVKEGENTITITNIDKKGSIRFKANKDVYIWVRNGFSCYPSERTKFETLVKGKDVVVLEEVKS